MALIAAHLNAGIILSGGVSVAIGIESTSPPTSIPLTLLLPVPT